MRIRVCYSELRSESFNNKKAEAEIEVEVNGDIREAFDKAWIIVKDQVERQLKGETSFEPPW